MGIGVPVAKPVCGRHAVSDHERSAVVSSGHFFRGRRGRPWPVSSCAALVVGPGTPRLPASLLALCEGYPDAGRREPWQAPIAVYHRHASVAGAGCIIGLSSSGYPRWRPRPVPNLEVKWAGDAATTRGVDGLAYFDAGRRESVDSSRSLPPTRQCCRRRLHLWTVYRRTCGR